MLACNTKREMRIAVYGGYLGIVMILILGVSPSLYVFVYRGSRHYRMKTLCEYKLVKEKPNRLIHE